MLDHRYDNVRVSYIMPGSVSTEFGSGGGADWKIQSSDIADIVLMLLRMPARTLVSRVKVTQPPQTLTLVYRTASPGWHKVCSCRAWERRSKWCGSIRNNPDKTGRDAEQLESNLKSSVSAG